MTLTTPPISTPTEARQRRMELRRNSSSSSTTNRTPKRTREVDNDDDSYMDDDDDDDHQSASTSFSSKTDSTMSSSSSTRKESRTTGSKKTKTIAASQDIAATTNNTNNDTNNDSTSIYRGIKKQARYEPTIPIASKAELAAWRKEARRIRNRESAAASRMKTKERIDVLEQQLHSMTTQYQTALQRIEELQLQLIQQEQEQGQKPLPVQQQVTENTTTMTATTSTTSTTTTTSSTSSDSEFNDGTLLLWSPEHQNAAEALASSLLLVTPPTGLGLDSTVVDNTNINIIAPDTALSTFDDRSSDTTISTMIQAPTMNRRIPACGIETPSHNNNDDNNSFHQHHQHHHQLYHSCSIHDPNLKNSRPTAAKIHSDHDSELGDINDDNNDDDDDASSQVLYVIGTNTCKNQNTNQDRVVIGSNTRIIKCSDLVDPVAVTAVATDSGTTTLPDSVLHDDDPIIESSTTTTGVSNDSGTVSTSTLFQSVDVSTFQDIFTDDATMEWIASISLESPPPTMDHCSNDDSMSCTPTTSVPASIADVAAGVSYIEKDGTEVSMNTTKYCEQHHLYTTSTSSSDYNNNDDDNDGYSCNDITVSDDHDDELREFLLDALVYV